MWPIRARPVAPKGRPFQTRDGAWVRSLGEKRVADFLSRRGIAYEYEPRIEGKRPDFLLPAHAIIIEYWGGSGFRDYDAKMQEKTALFEAAGYRMVHLLPINLRDLERDLWDALCTLGVAPADGA